MTDWIDCSVDRNIQWNVFAGMNESIACIWGTWYVDIHYTVGRRSVFHDDVDHCENVCCTPSLVGDGSRRKRESPFFSSPPAGWLAGGRSSVHGHHDGHISDTALLEASSSKYVEILRKVLCVFVLTWKETKLAKTAKGAEFSFLTHSRHLE
jgi:hypothetical protein